MNAIPPSGDDGREQIPLSEEDRAFLAAPIPSPDPEAWRALIMELRREAVLSQHQRPTGALPDGFEAAARSVTACERFFRAVAGNARVSEALRALSVALWSMPDGCRPEMFAFKRRGRPPTSPRSALVQAVAARAVTELMNAGEERLEVAAARVERALGGQIRARQILSRREKMMEGPGSDVSAYAIDFYRQDLPLQAGTTSQARAKHLLAWLTQQTRIPGNSRDKRGRLRA